MNKEIRLERYFKYSLPSHLWGGKNIEQGGFSQNELQKSKSDRHNNIGVLNALLPQNKKTYEAFTLRKFQSNSKLSCYLILTT